MYDGRHKETLDSISEEGVKVREHTTAEANRVIAVVTQRTEGGAPLEDGYQRSSTEFRVQATTDSAATRARAINLAKRREVVGHGSKQGREGCGEG